MSFDGEMLRTAVGRSTWISSAGQTGVWLGIAY
jgi:hypothetical protein